MTAQPELRFDGSTFDPARDSARLSTQARLVWSLMVDGRWRSLREIARAVGAPEASVSARLRDLRKPRFGGWTVDRRHVGLGCFEYRVRP